MIIDVEKLKNINGKVQEVEISTEIDCAKYDYEDIRFVGPVSFSGQIENAGNFLILTGKVNAVLDLECGNCLEHFNEDIEVEINEQYTNQIALVEEDEYDEISYFSGNVIDITPEVLNQIFMEMPMQPLCKPDCKGICPGCGVNLNLEECKCKDDKIDPRFEKLKILLSNMEKGEE